MGRISLVLMNVEGSDETVGMAIAKASELIGNMACDGAGGGNPSRGAGDKQPDGARFGEGGAPGGDETGEG